MKTLNLLCLSLLTLLALATPTWAVDAVVTTLKNEDDDPSGVDVSLKEAVLTVGNSGGKVTFAPSLNGGVIRLGDRLGTSAPIHVVIDAMSLPNGITLEGTGQQAFGTNSGSSLTLRGLTFRHTGKNVYPGLILMGSNSSLSVSDCTFSGMVSSYANGVIEALGGPSTSVEITRCTFVDNESEDNTIAGSNFISGGGAIKVFGGGGTVKITNSTFTRNKVGSAKSLNAMMAGGAILLNSFSGTCTLSHCTITGNNAPQGGGGLAVVNSENATVTVENCLITGNVSAPYMAGGADVTLNTFVLANVTNPPLPPKLQSLGVNIINKIYSQRGDGAIVQNNAPILAILDPKLAPLRNNGGRTQTMALQRGSYAIDRAPFPTSGLTTDQTGNPRQLGSKCDVGAYEYTPFTFNGVGVQVTTRSDELNDFPADGTGVSLREALTYAGDGSTITFSPSAFTLGSHTITLNPSLGPLKVKPGTFFMDASAIAASPDSAGVTVHGGGVTKVLEVDRFATVEVKLMTLKGGNGTFPGGVSAGGAINNSGKLTLLDCSVEDSTSASSGGGIENSGTVIAKRCTFSGNAANVGQPPPVISGGGALLNMGSATLENCTFSGNSATFGGAIDQFRIPGAPKPVLNITHCTISGNIANELDGGGGLYLLYDCKLTDSIISGNTALAQANDVTNDNDFKEQGQGLITAGVNIVPNHLKVRGGKLTGVAPLTGDPMLSALALNGGPTRTMALQAGSPAIDKTTNSLGSDQRGLGINGKADVGAFEFGTFGIGQFSVNLGDTTPPPPLGRAAAPIVISSGGSELTLNVAGNGSFSGTITFLGAKYTFRGQFGQNRTVSIQVTGKNLPTFTLELTLSGAQDELLMAKVTGTGFSGETSGPVAEQIPATNYQAPAEWVGRYTARMFDVDTLVGVMAVEITTTGVVNVTGGLYEGTKFTYSTRLQGTRATGVSFDGRIPLYKNRGYILFSGTELPWGDFQGQAKFFRPAGVLPAKPASVAGGFNRESMFSFQRYIPTAAGMPLVEWMATDHSMYVEVEPGFGSPVYTAYDTKLPPSLILTTTVKGLTLKINRATGVFTGTHPALPVPGQLPTTKPLPPLPFYGVLIQNDANAIGYGMGPSATRSYFIEMHPGTAP